MNTALPQGCNEGLFHFEDVLRRDMGFVFGLFPDVVVDLDEARRRRYLLF